MSDAPKLLSAARVAEIRARLGACVARAPVPWEASWDDEEDDRGRPTGRRSHWVAFAPSTTAYGSGYIGRGDTTVLPHEDVAAFIAASPADIADLLAHVAVLESMLADVARDDARGLVSLGARLMRERAVAALTEHAVKAYDVHGDAEEAGVIMARAVVAALPDHPEGDAK